MQNENEMEPIIPQEEVIEEALEDTAREKKSAAVTIVIQSWATPIAAILMLVAGFFAGFYSRPLLNGGTTPEQAGSATAGEVAVLPSPTADPDRAAQQQALMEAVTSVTRHFRGSPDAPVTIIEFSDFQ